MLLSSDQFLPSSDENTLTSFNSPSRGLPSVEGLVKNSHVFLPLSESQAEKLAHLYEVGDQFFSLPPEVKLRYSTGDHSAGYRPFGDAYADADVPDKRDLNDSYIQWNSKKTPPRFVDEISFFVSAMEEWRLEVSAMVAGVMEELCQHFNYGQQLGFDDLSILQMNSYNQLRDEDLLQQAHDDGNFLTLISINSVGLEAVDEHGTRPIIIEKDELLMMAGSIFTEMTGGETKPFLHQARNHRNTSRKSVMYFVNIYATLPPFHSNEDNDIDVRDRVHESSAKFGLSENFYKV